MRVPHRWTVALAFFALALVVYNLNGRCIPTHDSLPARLIPVALLTRGTLTLDQFGPAMLGHPDATYFYTHDRAGHRVSIYPVVVPLAATPFFIPAAAAMRRGDSVERINLQLELAEKISASVIAAASVAVVWLMLSHWATTRTAVMLTIAYAFGTETWMISSQALWQHGMSELLLAALLWVLSSTSTVACIAAGALSGLLVMNRPPNVLFAAAAGIYLLRTTPRGFAVFLAGATPFLALLLLYNLSTFGIVSGGYGVRGRISMFTVGDIPAGAVGLLFSPGRGLFAFSPFFMFLAGLRSRLARAALPLPWMALAAMLQLAMYASWRDWTGGECFGPRFLTDMTPVLMLTLIPVVDSLSRRYRLLFAAAVIYGIAVQAIGAFCYQMGGSGTARNQWSLANVQYLIELRAGPAPPSFKAWWDAAVGS